MKPTRYILILVLFQILLTDWAYGYQFKQNDLSVSAEAPPVLIYVENKAGQKTGADPALPMTSEGGEGNSGSTGLDEIPISQAIQIRGEGASSTVWNIDIYDADRQIYTVYLKGLAFGVAEIQADGIVVGGKELRRNIYVLISPGETRKVSLEFYPDVNPNISNLSLQSFVSQSDFVEDVRKAIQLHLVTSDHTAQFLLHEAELLKSEMDQNHNAKAASLAMILLHALGYQSFQGCPDKDYHMDVKEPALTILYNDSSILLNDVSADNPD